MRIVRRRAIALALVLGIAAIANSQTAPSMVQVTTVTVKPSMIPEFEDYVKKLQAAATKIGLTQRISAYQVTMGTSSYTYLFAARLPNWAALDALPSPSEMAIKAYGDVEAARIMKAGRTAIEDSRVELSRYRAELSTNFKLLDPIPAFVYMVRTEVKPDMVSAYEEYLSKLKAAQEQVPNHPSAIRISSVQGPANFFVTVQYYSKQADRDTWPNPAETLSKSVGEPEARRLTENSARAIAKREYWLMRYRPDLSLGGTRTSSN